MSSLLILANQVGDLFQIVEEAGIASKQTRCLPYQNGVRFALTAICSRREEAGIYLFIGTIPKLVPLPFVGSNCLPN